MVCCHNFHCALAPALFLGNTTFYFRCKPRNVSGDLSNSEGFFLVICTVVPKTQLGNSHPTHLHCAYIRHTFGTSTHIQRHWKCVMWGLRVLEKQENEGKKTLNSIALFSQFS